MRRYWKLAVLVPFIVLGISTYYVDASASNQSDYYLETLSGNAQAAANVQLQVNAQLQAFVPMNNVTIGAKGSESPSFWASLDANYYRDSLRNLVKEYPQFMRGKQNPNGVYVDNRVIGYANMELQGGLGISIVNVSVYNKQQKTSSSFTVALPNTTSSSVGPLFRVMIYGNNMKLFTLNYNGNGGQAIHLYTLDLNQKRVVSDQTVLSVGPSNPVALSVVNYTDDLEQPSDYTVFSETHYNPYNPDSPHTSILLVYDIQSGKMYAVKNSTITNILKNDPGAPGVQMNQLGNQLYVISQRKAKGQWRVFQYDLVENKIRKDFTFSLNNFESSGGVVNLAKISHHRLYMVVTSSISPTVHASCLAIVDLDTGKVLYQGVVMRKDKKDPGNVGIYNLSVN